MGTEIGMSTPAVGVRLGCGAEGPLPTILEAVRLIREKCHEMGSPKVELQLSISSRVEPPSLDSRAEKTRLHMVKS